MKNRLITVPRSCLALMLAVALGGIAANLARADFIDINPVKDNTLYEYVPADGDRSNGIGDHFFAGKTGMGFIRRGMLAFDIAGSVPPGSTITSVSLTMHMSRTALSNVRTVELHRLMADWGEGTSDATANEGQGAPATANDATWRHRFYNTIFWTTQGGDFSGTVSASQSVGDIGDYTWSSAQMTTDVQLWLDNPAINFGWLVLGDESTSTTTKRFDTRESASPPVPSYPIHGTNPESDSDSFADCNAYANTYSIKHTYTNSDTHPKSDNNTYTNSLADTFLASPAFPTCCHRPARVDWYRRSVRADFGWTMH